MFSKLSKISLYAALFAVLIVMTSTLFPFIGGKDYWFRITTELALIFFLLSWAFEDENGDTERRIKETVRKPIFIAVTAFAVASILATVFALDSHAAFWSNFERGEGSFQLLHYYAWFFLAVLLFRDEADWRRAFWLSTIAGVGMILYGVIGTLGWASNFIVPQAEGSFWTKITSTRFQGTLGNPAYVAPYLMFSMFYAAYLWTTGKNRKKWFAIAGWSLLILFFLIFFTLSQTRGAFVGLGIAAVAAALYIAIKAGGRYRKWFLSAFVALVLIAAGLVTISVCGGGSSPNPTCVKVSDTLSKLPAGRLLQISPFDRTAQTRFWTWGSAWQGFLERPIFGWGQENFSAVFDKYFDPRHFNPNSSSETWFDRAHSIYFDYLAETGIVGLLAYLSIFAAIFAHLLSKKSGEDKTSSTAVRVLLLALPVGYLVQGIAIFDVLPMYVNLFLFFAFAYYYFYRRNPSLVSK